MDWNSYLNLSKKKREREREKKENEFDIRRAKKDYV